MKVKKRGDGRPGAVGEAALEKAGHGGAGLPQARCGDAAHPPCPKKPSVQYFS